jgi:hypothetical protein
LLWCVPPTSQHVNWILLCVTVSTLKPMVGMVVTTSPSFILYLWCSAGERGQRGSDRQPPVISLECQRGHDDCLRVDTAVANGRHYCRNAEGKFCARVSQHRRLARSVQPKDKYPRLLASAKQPNQPIPQVQCCAPPEATLKPPHYPSPPVPSSLSRGCSFRSRLHDSSASSCPALVMRSLAGVFMCVHVWWMRVS